MVCYRVILVVGLLPYESGKTWFTVSLARGLLRRSVRAGVYKPVSAHSAWFQYATVARSRELSMLIGSDVSVYMDLKLIDTNEVPIVNPVDILTVPHDVEVYLDVSLGGYLHSLEDVAKQVALTRITNCQDGTYEYYVVRENLDIAISTLRSELVALSEALKAKDVSAEHVLSLLKSSWINRNLDGCLSRLCASKDLVIVESFSDSITPYAGLLDRVDAVIAVCPGSALIFDDTDRVRRAVEECVKDYGDIGLRVASIIMRQRLKARGIVKLAPRPSVSDILPDDVVKEFIG